MKEPGEKDLTIADLVIKVSATFRFLLTKWLLILLVAIAAGLLGVLFAWLEKPKYVAVITFFTEGDAKSSLGSYAGIAAQFGIDLGGSGGGVFEGENLMEILKSKTIVKKTLLSPIDDTSGLLMIDKYLLDNEINKNWRKDAVYRNVRFEQNPTKPDRVRDSILDKVYEGVVKSQLNIQKRDKKLDLIDVVMVSGNEYFSKRFVELLTANAIRYYTDYKIKKSRQNVEILQRQTDSVRAMLFGNISQVAEMNDVNVNPLRQVLRTGVQRKQVDVQANSLLYGELVKNLELSRLGLRKETPLIQVIDQPTLPLKKVKHGRLLTGILFAFVGALLSLIYLLLRRWAANNGLVSLAKPVGS